MQPVTNTVPGFKVTKTEGKTIFHRVPIFAECSRGDLTFGADWIAGAVAEAKQQERDGYLPPLHTRHHEPATEQSNSVEGIGVFRIVEASPFSFKGTRITAIFADLIVTDDRVAEEIENMKYPYRSVEIFDPEGSPKINGLALLDHEAPYLELPMLFAGEIDDKREGKYVASANKPTFSLNYADKPGDHLLWSSRSGNRTALLFKFPNEDMTNTTNTEQSVPTNFEDNGEDKKPAYMEDNGDDNQENMEEGGMDINAVCEAIKSGEISVADMDALLEAIQAQQSEPEAVEEVSDEDDVAPAPAPGAEIMKGSSAMAQNFAKIQGENEALKARLDARDAQDKCRADVANAMKRLEGKPLGSDLEERLTLFHNNAKGDDVLFKAYVDSMANTAGMLPVDNNGEIFSAHPKTPKSAMAFQSLGSEAVDKASQFARQYAELKGGIRASEEAYVRVNMSHLGFNLEDATTTN
tara:strand:+ start:997 stop:2397 length:1401 start_codon:yes stop_codon:yes gene_type:complete